MVVLIRQLLLLPVQGILNKEDTVFILLIRNGHLEVVQFLINGKHCNPDAADKNGFTALHLAVR